MASRRDFLGAGLGTAGALAATGMVSPATAATRPVLPVALEFLRTERLLHRDRAAQYLGRFGYSAYVAGNAVNVLYLSNHYPLSARMGGSNGTLAVLSAREDLPLGIVMPQFSYYFTYQEGRLDLGHVPYLHTSPMPDGPGASPPRLFPAIGAEPISETERQRRAAVGEAGEMFAGQAAALRRALEDAGAGRGLIATDNPEAAGLIESLGLKARCIVDEDILRAIRLAKTPAELKVMRLASAANIAATLEAAQSAREHGSLRQMRWQFYSRATARGNRPVFMLIDAVADDYFDAPLVEGRAFLIDSVSELYGYHGDFGRTIVIGEASRAVEEAVRGIGLAWQEVLQMLRPGVSFAEITRFGRETLSKLGYDIPVSFGPHAVGLAHTDHPRSSRYREGLDGSHVLVEDMVLSIDCPLLATGIDATVHFEDLVQVTATGASPIHDSHEYLIRV